MKVVQILAIANATLALVSALLGVAPFTPAIFLFVIYTPLACIFAAMNQTAAAAVVVLSFMVAGLLSPVRHESPMPGQLWWPLAWVLCCSVLALALSFAKVRTALLALSGVGQRGA